MSEKLTIIGSYLALFAAVLGLLSGQFLLATVVAAIGVWGLRSHNRRSALDDVIASDLPIPTAAELKSYREKNPDLSFSEAIVAWQKGESA